MSTHEYREQDHSGSTDRLRDIVLAWIVAFVAVAVISVALPS
jgi:hypothetical protein